MDKDEITKRFEQRMEKHDERLEDRIKNKVKLEKKLDDPDIPEAEVNQRIDYTIGVDQNGMVFIRFTANQKPIKLSTLSFDINGAMALANNIMKIVNQFKTQQQIPPTARPV